MIFQTTLEHSTRVDLRARAFPTWQITTYFRHGILMPISEEMVKKKIYPNFRVDIEPFEHAKKFFAILTPIPQSPQEDHIATRAMLRILHIQKVPIIWKEGRWGYEIDLQGGIKRKWKLTVPYKTKAFDTNAHQLF